MCVCVCAFVCKGTLAFLSLKKKKKILQIPTPSILGCLVVCFLFNNCILGALKLCQTPSSEDVQTGLTQLSLQVLRKNASSIASRHFGLDFCVLSWSRATQLLWWHLHPNSVFEKGGASPDYCSEIWVVSFSCPSVMTANQ